MRTNTLQWKAGATKAEAVRNRPALLAKADLKFTEKRAKQALNVLQTALTASKHVLRNPTP